MYDDDHHETQPEVNGFETSIIRFTGKQVTIHYYGNNIKQSVCEVLSTGGGGGSFPPNVSAPPPPKKVFPEKELKAISNTDLIRQRY